MVDTLSGSALHAVYEQMMETTDFRTKNTEPDRVTSHKVSRKSQQQLTVNCLINEADPGLGPQAQVTQQGRGRGLQMHLNEFISLG